MSFYPKHLKKTFLFLCITVIFLSCQKIDENTIPPVIFLNGSNPMIVLYGCGFDDPGISVIDDKGDDVTILTSGTVNPDSIGIYYIDYTAIDVDNNKAYKSRKVMVETMKNDDYLGSYLVKDTMGPYNTYRDYYSKLTKISNDTLKIMISNFNDFGNNFKITFTYDSLGFIQIDPNTNDTIIEGIGSTYCEKNAFRLQYVVTIENKESQVHRATFIKQ